jgi:hypothetical protein
LPFSSNSIAPSPRFSHVELIGSNVFSITHVKPVISFVQLKHCCGIRIFEKLNVGLCSMHHETGHILWNSSGVAERGHSKESVLNQWFLVSKVSWILCVGHSTVIMPVD